MHIENVPCFNHKIAAKKRRKSRHFRESEILNPMGRFESHSVKIDKEVVK